MPAGAKIFPSEPPSFQHHLLSHFSNIHKMAAVAENGHTAVADENTAPAVAPSDEIVTVLHNPENFNVKHPLMHEWTLWFTKPPSGKVSSSNA